MRISKKTIITAIFLLIGVFQIRDVAASEQREDAVKRLDEMHSKMRLKHGQFFYEYPEQLITTMFLPSDAKVLELGSNLGNNSCVISSILKDSSNLVTMETREDAIPLLTENRDINGFKFHIEFAALSKVPLVQKAWVTIPSDIDIDGYFRVNTVSFGELEKKHNIEFDTLVVDAEGALYQILLDDPDILKNIKLVIIENDFQCAEHCWFVLDLFKQNGLEVVYEEGYQIYGVAFNQVWKKS